MVGYTITIIIATFAITIALKAFWEHYKEQREREKAFEKQELKALIDSRIENYLKQIIKE